MNKIVRIGALGLLAVLLVLLPNAAKAAPSATKTSTGSGNWNTAGSWSPSGVPANGDDVIIAAGHNVTVDVNTNNLNSLTVNGTLTVGNNATNRTVTVGGNVTVASGGTIVAGATSATHSMNIGGNLANNGTFDGLPAAGRIINVTFNGSGNQTISGTGTMTRFNNITINNSSSTNIVEVTSSNFSASSGFLTLSNGIFKLSGTFAFSNTFFSAASYNILSGTGLWLNNANATVTGQNGSPVLFGLLRISSGTYNVGSQSGNSLRYNNNSSFMMEGGTLNVAGRFVNDTSNDKITFNMSGGTMTLATSGTSNANEGTFDISASSSTFTMSSGTIVLQTGNGNASGPDYRNVAGTVNITGGTVQFGNASTSGSTVFDVVGTSVAPNVVINATGTPTLRLVNALTVRGDLTIATGTTLDANNQNLTITGDWINHGTFTPGTGTVTFNGSSAQTIGGSTQTTFNNLTINTTGITPTLSTTATVNGVLNLTAGNLETLDNTLILANAATCSGTTDVLGLTKHLGTFMTGQSYCFGNPNITLNFTGAGTKPTDVTVYLTTTVPAGTGFATPVKRYYAIIPNGGSGFSATVRLHYRNSELNGNTVFSLDLWRRDSGTTWTQQAATARTTGSEPNNWIEHNGTTAFSPWMLSSSAPGAPTAVQVSTFEARSGGQDWTLVTIGLGLLGVITLGSVAWFATKRRHG